MAWYKCIGGNGSGGSTNYSGITTPDNDLGVNGDTYTKYVVYAYDRLNYVESNGGVKTQYVDTGIQFSPNSDVKMKVNIDSTVYANYQCMFGTRDTNPWLGFYTRFNGNNNIVKDEQNAVVSMNGIYDTDVDIEFTSSGMSITDGTDTYNASYNFNATTAQTMRLFSASYGGAQTSEQGKYQLYDFVWKENGITVIHYVPVIDENDIPCLLNTVDGTLHYSTNSSYPLISGGLEGTTVSGVRVVQTYLKVAGEWQQVNNIYPRVAISGNIAEYKTYMKFNGSGIVLPWTQNSDYKIECVFYEKEYYHDTCITGNSEGYTQGQYIATYQNRFDVGTGSSYSNLGSWSSGEHTYINNDENSKSTLDGTTSANYTPTTNDKYYTLGCRENGGMGYKGYIKSFKIYSKSTQALLHYLRPCIVGGTPAFIDVADNNTLYFGSGLQAVDEIPS